MCELDSAGAGSVCGGLLCSNSCGIKKFVFAAVWFIVQFASIEMSILMKVMCRYFNGHMVF